VSLKKRSNLPEQLCRAAYHVQPLQKQLSVPAYRKGAAQRENPFPGSTRRGAGTVVGHLIRLRLDRKPILVGK
jgi:hypothetical protein